MQPAESLLKKVQNTTMGGLTNGDQVMLDRITTMRNEYALSGENDPAFYQQIDEMENHLLK